MSEEKGMGYCDTKTIAKLFGVSVRRIQQLTQDGVIETVKVSSSRKYDMEATIKQYIEYLSDKANGRSKSAALSELSEQKLRAEIALKESQGELHKIKTDIALGKYISVEEVRIDYSKFFMVFKKFALSIPNKVAGRLNGAVEPVEVRNIEKNLQNEINKILKTFVSSVVAEEGDKDA